MQNLSNFENNITQITGITVVPNKNSNTLIVIPKQDKIDPKKLHMASDIGIYFIAILHNL